MNEMDAPTIAQRFFDETTQMRLSDELFAPDVVLHNYFLARAEVQGIDRVRAAFALAYNAFPDAHVSIHEVLTDADTIVVRHTHHGTFTGPILSVPPTGQAVEFDGVEIFRIRDGKIVDIWNFDDNATLLRQMGLLDSSTEYQSLVNTLAEGAQARAAG